MQQKSGKIVSFSPNMFTVKIEKDKKKEGVKYLNAFFQN